eukprot:scaffold1923_cov160-Amphora_coffeaeformis.AAC.14
MSKADPLDVLPNKTNVWHTLLSGICHPKHVVNQTARDDDDDDNNNNHNNNVKKEHDKPTMSGPRGMPNATTMSTNASTVFTSATTTVAEDVPQLVKAADETQPTDNSSTKVIHTNLQETNKGATIRQHNLISKGKKKGYTVVVGWILLTVAWIIIIAALTVKLPSWTSSVTTTNAPLVIDESLVDDTIIDNIPTVDQESSLGSTATIPDPLESNDGEANDKFDSSSSSKNHNDSSGYEPSEHDTTVTIDNDNINNSTPTADSKELAEGEVDEVGRSDDDSQQDCLEAREEEKEDDDDIHKEELPVMVLFEENNRAEDDITDNLAQDDLTTSQEVQEDAVVAMRRMDDGKNDHAVNDGRTSEDQRQGYDPVTENSTEDFIPIDEDKHVDVEVEAHVPSDDSYGMGNAKTSLGETFQDTNEDVNEASDNEVNDDDHSDHVDAILNDPVEVETPLQNRKLSHSDQEEEEKVKTSDEQSDDTYLAVGDVPAKLALENERGEDVDRDADQRMKKLDETIEKRELLDEIGDRVTKQGPESETNYLSLTAILSTLGIAVLVAVFYIQQQKRLRTYSFNEAAVPSVAEIDISKLSRKERKRFKQKQRKRAKNNVGEAGLPSQ